MSTEWVAIYITVISIFGTGLNLWITTRIRNDILELKLWALEEFVKKNDMTTYLSPIKDSIQMVGSMRRMKDQDPGFPAPHVRGSL